MFGVNYKYEVHETKNMIKLRPTLGSTLAFTAMSMLSVLVPTVIFAVVLDQFSSKTPEPEVPQSED